VNSPPLAATLATWLVDHLLARAILAAYHDKSHKLWIALARLVAKIVERGGAI